MSVDTRPSQSGAVFGGLAPSPRKPGNSKTNGQTIMAAQAARNDARLAAHRSAIEGGIDIPTLTITDHRKRFNVRGSCQFCGGTAFNIDVPGLDADNPQRICGEVTCLLCSRTVCHLVIGATRRGAEFLSYDAPRRGRPPKNVHENGARP